MSGGRFGSSKCKTNSLWVHHVYSTNVTSNPCPSRKPLLISITTKDTLESLASVADGLRESWLSLEVDEEEGGGKKGG